MHRDAALQGKGIGTPPRPGSSASLTEAFRAAFRGRPVANSAVFVGFFELDDWWPWLDDAARLIDAAEQARTQARRQSMDRDRLVLCYALHRLLLAEFLCCDASAVPLGRDPSGCPRVAAEDVRTSLSHSGTGMAAAVTVSGPVGVDIEPVARAPGMADIVGRVCHPDDMASIGKLPAHLRGIALLRLWVRKEACLKADGIGLQREMNTFAAAEDAVLPLLDGSLTQVRMLDPGSGWVAAGAAPPGTAFRTAWLRPARPRR